jgi:hypothetical protein
VLFDWKYRVVILPPQSNVRQEHGQCANLVPAESTVNLLREVLMLKYSAKGDRQIFPKQTIKIFTDIMCLER